MSENKTGEEEKPSLSSDSEESTNQSPSPKSSSRNTKNSNIEKNDINRFDLITNIDSLNSKENIIYKT